MLIRIEYQPFALNFFRAMRTLEFHKYFFRKKSHLFPLNHWYAFEDFSLKSQVILIVNLKVLRRRLIHHTLLGIWDSNYIRWAKFSNTKRNCKNVCRFMIISNKYVSNLNELSYRRSWILKIKYSLNNNVLH